MALERMFLIKFLTETEDAQRGAMALGASLLSIPSAALWAGSTVESTMARVDTAIVAAGANTAELGARFSDLGKDASVMLNVSEMAAKMGIQGADNLEKFATVASKMGTATGVGAEAAGGSLSRMGLAMDYDVEQMEKLASGMVALSSKTMVSTSALESVIVRLGPMAKEAKIGEPVIMALAAAFEQHGLKARQAIMPLTRFIEMMKKGKVPGAQLARSVGLTGAEFEKWKTAAPEKRVEMFSEALAKMDPDKAKNKLKKLKLSTGMYSAQTLAAFKDTKNLSKMLGIASEGMANNSALNEEAAQIQGTLVDQLKAMWTSLKAVGAQVGLVMIPFVKIFVGVLRGLVTILSIIPKPILALIAAFSALVGAILTGIFISRIQFVKAAGEMVVAVFRQVKAILFWIANEELRQTVMAKGAVMEKTAISLRIASGIASLKAAAAGGVLAQIQVVLGWLGFSVGASQAAGAAGTAAMGGAAGASVAPTAAAATATTGLWTALGPLALIAFAVAAAIVVMIFVLKKAIKLWNQGGVSAKVLAFGILQLLGPIGWMVSGILIAREALKPFISLLKTFWKALMGAFDKLYAPFEKFMKAADKASKILLPILIILLPPIAGLVAGFYLLKLTLDGVVWVIETVATAMEEILAPFTDVLDTIGGLLDSLEKATGVVSFLKGALKVLGIILVATFFLPVTIIVGLIYLLGKIVAGINWLIGSARTLGVIFLIAFSPFLVILAPIIGIIWAIIEAVIWLTGALAGSGLEEAWRFVTIAFEAFASIVMAPIKMIIGAIKSLIGMLGKLGSAAKIAVSVVAAPFKAAWGGAKKAAGAVWEFTKGAAKGVAGFAKKAWSSLFGSSFLHIAEGVRAILPFLQLVAKLFLAITDSARPPAISGMEPGGGTRATIAGTIPTAGAVAAGAISPAAPVAASTQAGAPGQRASAQPSMAKITIPVTVALDGMVLARALSEYMVELKAERNMNEPSYPLRGVEPAY
jgi:TP901 family phage tail tape measure protein